MRRKCNEVFPQFLLSAIFISIQEGEANDGVIVHSYIVIYIP